MYLRISIKPFIRTLIHTSHYVMYISLLFIFQVPTSLTVASAHFTYIGGRFKHRMTMNRGKKCNRIKHDFVIELSCNRMRENGRSFSFFFRSERKKVWWRKNDGQTTSFVWVRLTLKGRKKAKEKVNRATDFRLWMYVEGGGGGRRGVKKEPWGHSPSVALSSWW